MSFKVGDYITYKRKLVVTNKLIFYKLIKIGETTVQVLEVDAYPIPLDWSINYVNDGFRLATPGERLLLCP